MGVAIVKTTKYEARRFDSEEDAGTFCSAQIHLEFLHYHDCPYEVAQEVVGDLNVLDLSQRKAAESKLGEIIEAKIKEKQQP